MAWEKKINVENLPQIGRIPTNQMLSFLLSSKKYWYQISPAPGRKLNKENAE
jgi:hypothetical protein